MLQRLYSAEELAERYKCSQCTARRYMRQMRHMENPLRVFETDLREWEVKRTVESPEVVRERVAKVKAAARERARGRARI